MLIDTHAHIFSEYYVDKKQVINNALKNNINIIINNGCDRKTCEEVLNNSDNHVFGAIGIHPEAVLEYKEEDLAFIKENLDNPRIVAIGEIGLDYHYGMDNRLGQIALLEKQLALAMNAHLPVIIHARDANKDMLDILKKYKLKGVIHSFEGTKEEALAYISLGFKLGVNGIITFKNNKLVEFLKEIPLENIVLETDSPYLAPVPLRGRTNEPKNILLIAQVLQEIYHVSLENLAETTSKNAFLIFDKLPRP